MGFDSRFSIYAQPTGGQFIPCEGRRKIVLTGVEYDCNSEILNSRFTPKESGYYHVSAGVGLLLLPDGKSYDVQIYKNGERYKKNGKTPGHQNNPHCPIAFDVYLEVGDYLELWVWQNKPGGIYVDEDGDATYFTGHRFA